MDFSQIGILLGLAALFGIVSKRFRQPLLVGYLFAGVLASYLGLIANHELFESLGKIGVALLLFLVGIEMNIKDIPTIGKVALLTGICQIIVTFSLAFLIALSLNFGPLASGY